MSERQRYMKDLRQQVAELLGERQQISLAALERDLETCGFPHMVPGRTTLARAVTGLGWYRIPRPGSGAVYARGNDA